MNIYLDDLRGGAIVAVIAFIVAFLYVFLKPTYQESEGKTKVSMHDMLCEEIDVPGNRVATKRCENSEAICYIWYDNISCSLKRRME